MKNKRLMKYLLITFLISWIAWGILGVLVQNNILEYGSIIGTIIFTVGGFGPTISAIILLEDKKNFKNVMKYIFSHKKKSFIYLFIFCILEGVTIGVSSMELNPDMPIYIIPFVFLIILVASGGNEELGWRGLMQPTLERKMPYPIATIITGVIWAIWHLPLWFIEGTTQSNMPFILFAAFAMLLSFWLACIFRNTKCVFYCSILHTLSNVLMSLFVIKVNWILILGLILTTVISVILPKKELSELPINNN